MVFTVPATLAFFTEDTQMGLQVRTRVHLATEGIDMVEDLAEFAEEDSWRQVIDNCRRPPKILNAAGNLVEQEAFHLGAKSLRRLQVAAKCVHYYFDYAMEHGVEELRGGMEGHHEVEG
jgi:hypothetical protein